MALTPVFIVVCGLLVVAGASKLARPGAMQEGMHTLGWPVPTALIRVLGIGEIAVGCWAAISPSTSTGIVVALTYGAFCGFLLMLRRADGAADCGCFGTTGQPPGALHLALNAAAALAGVLVAITPTQGLGWMLSRSPELSLTLIVGTTGAVFAAYLAYTLVPDAWRAYGSGTDR